MTIYPPKPLAGGEIGIAAVINTPSGPVTVMAKGEKRMLALVGKYAKLAESWANGVSKRVFIAGDQYHGASVERVFNDVLNAIRGVVHGKAFRPPHLQTAQMGAASTRGNVTFDLAYAYDAGSADAQKKVADFKSRSDAGDRAAASILKGLKLAQAANQTISRASMGEPDASQYIVDLQARAKTDETARARLCYLAACRARMLIRPVLTAKARAAKGDASAAAQLEQALRRAPDLVPIVNASDDSAVYYDEDVQAQDADEYGEVGAPMRFQLKDPYSNLRTLLRGLTINVKR